MLFRHQNFCSCNCLLVDEQNDLRLGRVPAAEADSTEGSSIDRVLAQPACLNIFCAG